jgi:hypothetical protein
VKITPAAATSRAVVLLSMKRREKKDIPVRLVAFSCLLVQEAQYVTGVTIGDHLLNFLMKCLIVTMKILNQITTRVGISDVKKDYDKSLSPLSLFN